MEFSLNNRKLSTNIRKKKRLTREAMWAYIFVGIPILGYIFFNIFPLAISFFIQFFDMEYSDLSTLQWNNFANFAEVFTDTKFYLSIGVSFLLCLNQLISLCIALLMSVLLSKKPFGHKIFQIIYFIPYICSSIAVSLMWIWMFNEDYGIINSLLQAFGLSPVKWYHDYGAYPWMIIIACVWQAPGYGIVMYKAALSAVNPSLYEASDIDGANAWKKFTHITFPAIAPTTFFLLMTGIINGLQTFDMAQMFAARGPDAWAGYAGPGNMGLTTVLYIYNKGAVGIGGDMPVASVMSWALFVIIFFISMINFYLRKKWVDE